MTMHTRQGREETRANAPQLRPPFVCWFMSSTRKNASTRSLRAFDFYYLIIYIPVRWRLRGKKRIPSWQSMPSSESVVLQKQHPTDTVPCSRGTRSGGAPHLPPPSGRARPRSVRRTGPGASLGPPPRPRIRSRLPVVVVFLGREGVGIGAIVILHWPAAQASIHAHTHYTRPPTTNNQQPTHHYTPPPHDQQPPTKQQPKEKRTANRFPSALRRMWFTTVVLPEPRKPVRRVTGSRFLCRVTQRSTSSFSCVLFSFLGLCV